MDKLATVEAYRRHMLRVQYQVKTAARFDPKVDYDAALRQAAGKGPDEAAKKKARMERARARNRAERVRDKMRDAADHRKRVARIKADKRVPTLRVMGHKRSGGTPGGHIDASGLKVLGRSKREKAKLAPSKGVVYTGEGGVHATRRPAVQRASTGTNQAWQNSMRDIIGRDTSAKVERSRAPSVAPSEVNARRRAAYVESAGRKAPRQGPSTGPGVYRRRKGMVVPVELATD